MATKRHLSKPRRVSHNSTYNLTMQRWESEYAGEEGFANHKSDWTNEQLDELLEAFIVLDLPFAGAINRDSLLVRCKRTLGAIKVALWKLAGHYVERRHFADYTPQKRTVRPPRQPWSMREMALVALATNDSGISREAYKPEWIGKILGRSPKQVKAFYDEIVAKRHTGFRAPSTEEIAIARIVHEAMKPYLRQIEGMIHSAILRLEQDEQRKPKDD